MKSYHKQTTARRFRSLTGWLENKYHQWLQRRAIAHYKWRDCLCEQCDLEWQYEEWRMRQTENVRPDRQMEMRSW